MTDGRNPEELFEQAIEAFPYPNLQSTSVAMGELENAENGEIEYSEEYTFDAGKMINETLVGGGWIEYRQDSSDDDVSITAIFSIAREGDFENKRILGEYEALQGNFDLETGKWEFWIDSI